MTHGAASGLRQWVHAKVGRPATHLVALLDGAPVQQLQLEAWHHVAEGQGSAERQAAEPLHGRGTQEGGEAR